MTKGPIASLVKAARAFWQDTDGVILPYVTLLLVVLVGTSVLALDGARVVSLQTQLQKGADALAIAGAAELNQKADAITRAANAINNKLESHLVNKTLPGLLDQNVEVSQIQFIAAGSLPASDADPITAVLCTYPACTTENAEDAVYLEVTVVPVQLPTILPASFFGGTNSVTTGASAVAGRSDEVICGIPPVFMCNPYETAGMTDKAATDAMKAAMTNPVEKRRQWRLKADKTGPGQFGWLTPPDGCNSADCLRDWISQVNPEACYKKSSVNLNTGVMATAKHGFNVRFDIYHSPLKYSPSTAPAINVRRGYVATAPSAKGNWCKAEAGVPYYGNPDVMGLPLDKGWETDYKGNADWDCDAYWSKNHSLPVARSKPAACTSSATMSRYEVYRYEIDNDLVGDWSGNGQQKLSNADTGTGESGRPYCASTDGNNGVDTTTGSQDRRNISVALINCLAQGPFPPGANATDVPVAAFGDFFVTQPMGADPDHPEAIYGEFSKIMTLDDGATIYGIVQLYR